MKSRIRGILLSVVSAASLLATVVPAQANASSRTTGGCTGMGNSWVSTQYYAYSDTNSNPYGGCGWVYSKGFFVVGSINWDAGPGYVQASYAISEWYDANPIVQATGIHNLCNAGGPCSGSQQWGTSDAW
jgi:hypothetical protein